MFCLQMLFTELFNSDVHRQRADKFMNYWLHTVHKTPKGLAWADQWGPLRYAGTYYTLDLQVYLILYICHISFEVVLNIFKFDVMYLF